MNRTSADLHLPVNCLPGFLLLALVCLASCTSADTESGYREARQQRRTNCRGDEVVGVWTPRQGSSAKNEILLFRPDGTGRDRSEVGEGKIEERLFFWKYEGNGVWTGEEAGAAIAAPGEGPSKATRAGWRGSYTVHLTNDYLLCEVKPQGQRVDTRKPFGFGGSKRNAGPKVSTRRVFVKAS